MDGRRGLGWADWVPCGVGVVSSHSGATVVAPRVGVRREAVTEEEERQQSLATPKAAVSVGGCGLDAMRLWRLGCASSRETRDVNQSQRDKQFQSVGARLIGR